MTNYDLTTYKTSYGTINDVTDSLETYLETVDSTKTIYYVDIIPYGRSFMGIVIHAT